MLDIYPILTYINSIALLVTTAKKTQVITGLAPEKASRISTHYDRTASVGTDPWPIGVLERLTTRCI